MTIVVFVVLSILFVVALMATVIFSASLRWHERNIDLGQRNPRLFMSRWESPPWYVRITARVLQHPLDPPTTLGQREMR